MSVTSGIYGCIDGVHTVRNWRISLSADVQKVIASNTAGNALRLAGNKDWSGSFETFGGQPVLKPGESFTFTGKATGAWGVVGPAIVDQVEIRWDIEGGGPIVTTTTFSANGALERQFVSASDFTDPEPESSVGCKIEYAAPATSPQFNDIPDVRTVTLTMTSDNQSYVSSSTAGETKRMAGNWDVTLSIAVYESALGEAWIFPPNSIRALRLYINDTEFWLLSWMMFHEMSDIEVNRETGALIGFTYNAGFTGFAYEGASLLSGEIVTPDLTSWWAV